MSQLAREFFKFRHQTVCVEIISIINSQITKARDIIHISINLFNSFTIIWLYIVNIIFEKRKVDIISKLVGISEAIRLILTFLFFPLEFFFNQDNAFAIFSANVFVFRTFSINSSANTDSRYIEKENALKFNQWLAGLIDGDGHFILTKKGYTSCEICMDARDKKALVEIQHKYGGSIKTVSGAKAVKYKLRNKKGLISLINDINGLIRNPVRLLQMNKLCVKYMIDIKYAKDLTYNDG